MVFVGIFSVLVGSWMHSIYMLDLMMFKMTSLMILFPLIMDKLSFFFFGLLLVMSGSVMGFGYFYMQSESYIDRFWLIVILFILSMVCLMFTSSLFTLILGWDGLGVTSFLLVSYYKKDSSWAASLKTYMNNRVGDSFLMIFLGYMFMQGQWEMKSNFFILKKKLVPILLFFSLMTKSAQFPFSSWLPAAMAAPTPVSALVHSSTLVTAGVYLYIRFMDYMSAYIHFLASILGLITLYVGGISACFEYDMKRVVAFSTLSQLGLMVIVKSFKKKMLSFFHLLSHASFKALLFISVGFMMLHNKHSQDLRFLSLSSNYSVFNWLIFLASLSLVGFPSLSGYFSKDSMMESTLWKQNYMYMCLLYVSLFISSYYSFRLIYYLYFYKNTSNKLMYAVSIPVEVTMLAMVSVFMSKFILFNLMKYELVMPGCSVLKVLIWFLMISGSMFFLSFSNSPWVNSIFFSMPLLGKWVNSKLETEMNTMEKYSGFYEYSVIKYEIVSWDQHNWLNFNKMNLFLCLLITMIIMM